MPKPTRQGSNTASSKKSSSATSSTKTQNRWVFITKDEVIGEGPQEPDCQPSICKLRHPRIGAGVLFLVSGDCRSVCELNSFDEKFHSWFIGETVHSGNQIYFATPVDPLFLVLPYLINAGGKANRFMSLEQLVTDEELPDCHKILTCSGMDHILQVADRKDIDDDLQVYRYNSEKTLAWLKAKTDSLADMLEKTQVNVSAKSSQSSMFVRSKTSSASRESYVQYAFGMVSDYLPVAVEEDLRTYLGVPAVQEKPAVVDTVENERPNKKLKLTGDLTPTDDYSAGIDLKKDKSKTGKLTAAQKKLSKVDKSGMKSISSFFKSPKS